MQPATNILATHAHYAQAQIAALAEQATSLNALIRHYEAIIAATSAAPAAAPPEVPVEQAARPRRPFGAFKAALTDSLRQAGKVGASIDELKADIEQRLAGPVTRAHVSVELKKLAAKGDARRSGKLWAALA